MSHPLQVRPLCAALAGALLLAAHEGRAQQADPTRLPTVQVEGKADDGRLRPLGPVAPTATIDHDVAQSVSVIDRHEIDRLNPLSTMDLLGRIPGVGVNRAGGIAGTIFLRGLNSNDMRVPMFIDGDRFRGRNTLQYMLISPTELERVEVIRGPNSARFGSDGLGGLVNFVTRRAHGNLDHPFQITGGELSATYKSNGNGFQSNAALEAAGSGFDLRAYATTRRSSDYDIPSGTVPNSDYRSYGGGAVLGYMFAPTQRIEASVRTAYVEDGAAGTVPVTSITRRDPLRVNQWRLAYSGQFPDAPIEQVDASVYLNKFDTVLSVHNQANSARIVDTRNHVIGPWVYGGRLAARSSAGNAELDYGLDFMDERRPGSESNQTVTTASGSTSTGYVKSGPNQYQSNVGAFVDGQWKPASRWTLSAGARLDWFKSDVGLSPLPSADLLEAFRAAQDSEQSATTGSLGLSYQATEVIELVASAGTSFRMPWTSEMFSSGYTGSSYTIPNPNLKPERGRNGEAGVRLHFERASAGLTLFRSDYRNFLENVTTSYMGLPATQRRNVGRARIQGVEGDWRWQIDARTNLYGNASYLHATNRTTDQPLISIAPLSGLLGAQYLGTGEAWSLNGELQWAKGQSRYNASSEYPAAGYGVVNLSAEFQLDRLGLPKLGNTQLVVGVSNLFDRSYRTAATTSNVGYAMTDLNPLLEPGRSFDLTLRTRF